MEGVMIAVEGWGLYIEVVVVALKFGGIAEVRLRWGMVS